VDIGVLVGLGEAAAVGVLVATDGGVRVAVAVAGRVAVGVCPGAGACGGVTARVAVTVDGAVAVIVCVGRSVGAGVSVPVSGARAVAVTVGCIVPETGRVVDTGGAPVNVSVGCAVAETGGVLVTVTVAVTGRPREMVSVAVIATVADKGMVPPNSVGVTVTQGTWVAAGGGAGSTPTQMLKPVVQPASHSIKSALHRPICRRDIVAPPNCRSPLSA
jgi:hypothetical protein